MAVLGDDLRIPRLLPSLVHIAAVKVALYFFNESVNDYKILDKVFHDIQHEISTNFNEGSQNDRKAKRVHEKLSLIPKHLRHTVHKTITGIRYDNNTWSIDNIANNLLPHLKLLVTYVRSDGSVDRTKIACRFVMNKKADIRLRFYVACLYCFKESVPSLWKEMEARGETENFDTGNNVMMNFWVKWMQEGSRIPWLQALREHFIVPRQVSAEDRLLISPFFTLLQPEERQNFLIYVKSTINYNDFLTCLRAATKEEKVKILENTNGLHLMHFLNWPLQSIFLEVAEVVWHFLDASSFFNVLECIWKFQKGRRDFDYCQLFLDFWKKCPVNLKETVENNPTMIKKIKSISKIIIKKREKCSTRANEKKWVRRTGRLEKTT